mgnify:CR=1 FL=1
MLAVAGGFSYDLSQFDRVIQAKRQPGSTFKPPAQVQIESALGMHHSNLFAQPRVQASIQAWLTEP